MYNDIVYNKLFSILIYDLRTHMSWIITWIINYIVCLSSVYDIIVKWWIPTIRDY